MEREYDQLQREMCKISKLLRIVAVFLISKEFSLALSCSDKGMNIYLKHMVLLIQKVSSGYRQSVSKAFRRYV